MQRWIPLKVVWAAFRAPQLLWGNKLICPSGLLGLMRTCAGAGCLGSTAWERQLSPDGHNWWLWWTELDKADVRTKADALISCPGWSHSLWKETTSPPHWSFRGPTILWLSDKATEQAPGLLWSNCQDKAKILHLAREKKKLECNTTRIYIYPDFRVELTRRRQSFDQPQASWTQHVYNNIIFSIYSIILTCGVLLLMANSSVLPATKALKLSSCLLWLLQDNDHLLRWGCWSFDHFFFNFLSPWAFFQKM